MLKYNTEAIHEIINSLHDALFVYNSSDKIVYANCKMSELYGYTFEELLNLSFGELSLGKPPYDEKVADQRIQNTKPGCDQVFEWIGRKKNGETFWAEVILCCTKIEETPIVIATIRNIEDRKAAEQILLKNKQELEENLKTKTKQLEEANKELESFAYSVSHDLRAPLRAINGFTRILTEDYAAKIDSEGQRICHVIQNEAAHMGQLIDDLLSFSRLSRATMQISLIDMKQLAQLVFLELIGQSKTKEIDFILNDLPKVEGDLSLLRQVWTNLLSNAIKFTSKKEQPRIEISSIEKAAETIFCIKDNGAGFDMRYVDKLFGVFQRLHSQQEFDGTGVGLAIVQRILSRHGGRAWAEGTIDQGATFYFSLPNKNKAL